MSSAPESTCWTTIRAAGEGDRNALDRFARVYRPYICALLAERWHDLRDRNDLEDTAQKVLLECIKEGGPLATVGPDRPGGFRAFLRGVVRNFAKRAEPDRAQASIRHSGNPDDLQQVPDPLDSPSRQEDREWARALMREAADVHADDARQAGPDSERRLELLRLRFHEGLTIREIAGRWRADAARLHHEYAKARQEFRAALLLVVRSHRPGTAVEVERACAELLGLLA
jgi:RNA polymerase sigma-70 factor (ECF subfamily)